MRINGNIIGISDSDVEDAINGKNVNGVCHKFICPCNGSTGFTEEQANCLNDLVMDPELRTSVVHGCPDVISMTKEEVCSFLQRDGPFKKGDQIDPHLTDIGLEMLGLEEATHFKMVLGVSKPYTVVCESQ